MTSTLYITKRKFLLQKVLHPIISPHGIVYSLNLEKQNKKFKSTNFLLFPSAAHKYTTHHLFIVNKASFGIYSTNGLLNTYLPLLGRGEGFKNLKMSTYEPDDLLYLFVGVSMTKRQWHCTGISVLIHACMCFLERDLFT